MKRLVTATGMILFMGMLSLHGQMAEWYFFRDREGNRYFYDRAGKIHTTEGATENIPTISAQGLDYYLARARELREEKQYRQSLNILKAILAIPNENEDIDQAHKVAMKYQKALMRKEGSRYRTLAEEAAPQLYRKEKETRIIHEILRYQTGALGEIQVLKNKIRRHHMRYYHGLTFGIRKEAGEVGGKSTGYDYLLAIDGERYKTTIKKIEDLEAVWHRRLPGRQNLQRQRITDEPARRIYYYESRTEPAYRGYEAYIINGPIAYMVRTIAPVKKNETGKEDLEWSVKNFRAVTFP